MILVDTSVWIDHLRAGNEELARLLQSSQVLIHPHIIGELACRNLRNRQEIMSLLADLPTITVAADSEVLFFIEQQKLMGQGIGYIDTHLLAAVALDKPARLWSRDKRLVAAATKLGLAHYQRVD